MNKCIICDSDKIKREKNIYVCEYCGFYISDFYSKTDITVHYDSYDCIKHHRIAKSQKNIYRLIEKKIFSYFGRIKGLKIFEIGFGHGYFLYEMSNKGVECFGVDISNSAFDNALKIGLKKENLFLCDFMELNLKDVFDVIVMNGVIEEFRDPIKVFDKISEITAKGSIIVIRTKNALFHRFFNRYENIFSYFIRSPGVIMPCGFTYKSIGILLSRYGFELTEIHFNLTEGDPYKQSEFGLIFVLFKKIYYIISIFIFYISFKRLVISPSFIITGVKIK